MQGQHLLGYQPRRGAGCRMAVRPITRFRPGELKTREATPEDVPVCGRICHEAFRAVALKHGFTPTFCSVGDAEQVISWLFAHPGFYCVVAELDGEIVGSNCLDERSSVAGVGPITIDPKAQDRNIGRVLMTSVLERAAQREAPGVRLVQAAYHIRSLSLYSKLGFDVREPLALMQGAPMREPYPAFPVRPATEEDVTACDVVCRRVHGHDRHREVLDAVAQKTAAVVEHDGRITGYATQIGYLGHAVGEGKREIQALIASASSFTGPGFLVPMRNTTLFRWCLENGLRVVQPMTLMTLGLYNEPVGAYLPSILF